MSRILIDLSILRHPYCGLGQIAINYGRLYGQQASQLLGGHDVTLLVPPNAVGQYGDTVRYLPMHDIYRFMPQLMPHYDVWHSIHQFSPFRPFSSSTRRLLTIHDLNFMYEKPPAKSRKYLQRLQHECNRATEICFISHFAQSEATRLLELSGKPQHVIYNGVEDVTRGEQRCPSFSDERPFFLCMGVVKEKKNLHTLLPLMHLMDEYCLIIAGNDTDAYAERLRNEARQTNNIHILGPVSDSERRWLYAHCHALLFPSLCEGFGLPVIEAMQWGKPVVCSRSTSLPEIGSTHAFYFDSFQPDAMQQTVLHALANDTPAHAEAARQYAATFAYDNHMRQYATLIANLANSH